MVAERIPQPLPAEIQPPHFDLRDEWRLPVGQPRLPILTAIEVVHEAIVGCFAERAADANPGCAAGRLAFVDGGEVRRSKGLGEEWRHTEEERAGYREQK